MVILEPSSNGFAPLHSACSVATMREVILFFVAKLEQDHPCPISSLVAPGRWTVLHMACRCSQISFQSLRLLVDKAPQSLALTTADKGSSPLHLALLGHASSPAIVRTIVQLLEQKYPYAVILQNNSAFPSLR